MKTLIAVHRWLGVATALLFALWFASGLVLHFVPFPALTEDERRAGLAELSTAGVGSPADLLEREPGAARIERLRLQMVAGRPVWIVSRVDRSLAAVDARTGRPLQVDEQMAAQSAWAHARARRLAEGLQRDPTDATTVRFDRHDQWTVPNRFDAHRPLYRVSLGDAQGWVLHVSSVTGEVVLDSSRRERAWNWVGSVPHWIYPTVIRRDWVYWDRLVWTISLVALSGAAAGAIIGIARFSRGAVRYRGWLRWHYRYGLLSGLFVVCWIFSGWLSMDHGRLFSTGQPSIVEHLSWTGAGLSPHSGRLSLPQGAGLDGVREIEWFPVAGQTHVRSIGNADAGGRSAIADSLTQADLRAGASALSPDCGAPSVVERSDPYRPQPRWPGATVWRIECGAIAYHVDGTDARLVERLDSSRRLYRWLYQALHTWDWPLLKERPGLRSSLIVLACLAGFGFSLTAVVIGWRRLIVTCAPEPRRR